METCHSCSSLCALAPQRPGHGLTKCRVLTILRVLGAPILGLVLKDRFLFTKSSRPNAKKNFVKGVCTGEGQHISHLFGTRVRLAQVLAQRALAHGLRDGVLVVRVEGAVQQLAELERAHVLLYQLGRTVGEYANSQSARAVARC